MSYISFDKTQLINLEYALSREILRTNAAGSYVSTTITGCNTRKYHGLLICSLPQFENERFVLLSSLDETIIQKDSEFNFGLHKYGGDNYFPKGHKYIRAFELDNTVKTTYRVGGVILTKELILVDEKQQLLIRYTLVDAHSATLLRLKPFLAFRNIHTLTNANMNANTKITYVNRGIKTKLYPGFPSLHLQISKDPDFVHVPDWYYGIEYPREQKRGYAFREDLFVPGYFELPVKKGESIIFSASLEEVKPNGLKKLFTNETRKIRVPDNYLTSLNEAAKQFIIKRNHKTSIVAGYPWFDSWGRDTFISLPGLTLARDDEKTFTDIVDTQLEKLKKGLFPNTYMEGIPIYNSVDTPLWFIWALQQYARFQGDPLKVWKKYKKPVLKIIDAFIKGTDFNSIHENGLVWSGKSGMAVTWMDAVYAGIPVTPRTGFTVEINGLWYNSLEFILSMANLEEDHATMKKYKDLAGKAAESFLSLFWSPEKKYLADVVNETGQDFSVRPNQVIAAGMEFTPLSSEMIKSVLDLTDQELLTPRGLRSLSPRNPNYKGVYEGNQKQRDLAYHQGTAWPWLIQFYAEAYLRIHKRTGISKIRQILQGFEEEINRHGLGTISEVFDGDPPHRPAGAVSQAWSVASLLYTDKLLQNFELKEAVNGKLTRVI
ncbi:MAG: amylo-alpha-1,6-glucosidase [Bacteroidales bacterium]